MSSIKYYAVVQIFDRFSNSKHRVTLELEAGEDLKVVEAVLIETAFRGKECAKDSYKIYCKSKDPYDLAYYGCADNAGAEGTGGTAVGEEFNIGFAQSKEEAESFFLKTKEDEEPEWEED